MEEKKKAEEVSGDEKTKSLRTLNGQSLKHAIRLHVTPACPLYVYEYVRIRDRV
jgi:hypothetical protein